MTKPLPPAYGMCAIGQILLAAASKRRRYASLNELTDEELTRMTQADGVDTATAVLYELIRSSPGNRHFIERAEILADPAALSVPAPRVVVVPGAFYHEYPHTGGDGARILDLARELAWPAERAPLPSFAPMAQNAETLAKFLASLPRRPTVLFSLSKGGADVRALLERPDAADALRDVCAWVNLSGIVSGTALVNWLRARPLRCAGVKLLLRLRRQRFATLDELRRGSGAPLHKPIVIPPWIKAIHVAGFPLIRHLSDSWARRGHARLASIGPNDGGGVLLADVARLPGYIYPVWGADHYLRPMWNIRPLLLRLMHEAADPQP